jgi:hypothetical protein
MEKHSGCISFCFSGWVRIDLDNLVVYDFTTGEEIDANQFDVKTLCEKLEKRELYIASFADCVSGSSKCETEISDFDGREY